MGILKKKLQGTTIENERQFLRFENENLKTENDELKKELDAHKRLLEKMLAKTEGGIEVLAVERHQVSTELISKWTVIVQTPSGPHRFVLIRPYNQLRVTLKQQVKECCSCEEIRALCYEGGRFS